MNVKPNTGNAKPVDDKRSHHVRPLEMPWEKMRFPGCKTKTLLFDPKSGLATVLIEQQTSWSSAREPHRLHGYLQRGASACRSTAPRSGHSA